MRAEGEREREREREAERENVFDVCNALPGPCEVMDIVVSLPVNVLKYFYISYNTHALSLSFSSDLTPTETLFPKVKLAHPG